MKLLCAARRLSSLRSVPVLLWLPSLEEQMPIADESKILRPILFLLFALLTAGCATRNPNPPEQGIVSDAPLNQDEGIVFGTLSSGESKDDQGPGVRYSIHYAPKVDPIHQYNIQGGHGNLQGHTLYPVFFANRLPAGDYYVTNLATSNSFAYPKASFTVAPNKATYIGSIQVFFGSGAPPIAGILGPKGRVTVRVTNELEKVQQQYKQRNPRLPYEIATGLVRLGE